MSKRIGTLAPRSRRTIPTQEAKAQPGLPAIPAEAALSFLKDTKGAVSWRANDLTDVLKIGRSEAQHVVALLEAQGYVARANKEEWMTTGAGEAVSGAKTPRFSQESVEQAIAGLKDRIAQVNKDRNTWFRIAGAVAFGDFLLKDRAKVQAADVGVRLVSREESAEFRSASEAKAESKFLRELRGKAQMLNLRPYAEWMSKRSHCDLM
jgi:hypothetical protein